jgi:hypothetical protein
VIHEVMHMILHLHVSDEAKVVAISEVIQPRTRRHRLRRVLHFFLQRAGIELK